MTWTLLDTSKECSKFTAQQATRHVNIFKEKCGLKGFDLNCASSLNLLSIYLFIIHISAPEDDQTLLDLCLFMFYIFILSTLCWTALTRDRLLYIWLLNIILYYCSVAFLNFFFITNETPSAESDPRFYIAIDQMQKANNYMQNTQ
jgi:hypothetical protein